MNTKLFVRLFSTTVIATACATCFAADAANVEQFEFNVAPGVLSKVIAEISLQAKATISLDKQAGLQGSVEGVRGRMSLRQALEKALTGTNWTLQEGPGGMLSIAKPESLAVVTVLGRRQDFVRTETSMVTRTDTPLRQVPGTVDVVTEEVLQSQNALSVGEALRNIPGVIFSVGGTSQAYIGGDSTGGVTFTNGLRNSFYMQNPPVTDVEAVEVFKGPAAILTGSQVGGGVINLVPKRATGRRLLSVSTGIGSGGEKFASADLGSKISEEYGISGRLNLLYQDADRLPNGGNDPYSKVINPILGLNRPGLSVDLGFQWTETRTAYRDLANYDPTTQSLTRYGSRLSPEAHSTVESRTTRFAFEKDLLDLNSDVTLRLRGRAQHQVATRDTQFQSPILYDFMGMGSYAVQLASMGEDTADSAYLDLYSKFDVFSTQHQVIVAYDGREQDNRQAEAYPAVFFTKGATFPLLALPQQGPRSKSLTRDSGLVLQDQMTYGKFHTLIGVRKASYHQDLYSVNVLTQTVATEPIVSRTSKTLWNAGMVYDVGQDVSAYFSTMSDFKPVASNYLTWEKAPLPPQEIKRKEVGVKADLLQKKLSLNASAFRYTTSNSVKIDPDITHVNSYISAPGNKGHGYELSASGSVTPTFRMLSGMTYTSAKSVDGKPTTAVAKYVANFWAIKTFQLDGAQRSIDLGAGVDYNSSFWAQDPLTSAYVKVDKSYVSARLSLAYSVAKFRVNASVDNLFDHENIVPGSSISQLNLAAPRTFRVVANYKF